MTTPSKRSRHLPLAPQATPGKRRPVGCASCALCCTYVAIEIDPPTTLKRATQILWYLYHEHVSVYASGDDYMVQFETRCNQLLPDRRCGVYATRPHICREYSEHDCEVNSDDDAVMLYTPEQFLAHLRRYRKRVHTQLVKGFVPEVQEVAGAAAGHPFVSRLRAARALSSPPAN